MKDRNLYFKIPIAYFLLLFVFMLVVNLVVKSNTSEYNEIYSIIYSIGFFIAHPIYFYTLCFLLILPFPLLLLSVVKKKRNFAIGFLICSVLSSTFLIISLI